MGVNQRRAIVVSAGLLLVPVALGLGYLAVRLGSRLSPSSLAGLDHLDEALAVGVAVAALTFGVGYAAVLRGVLRVSVATLQPLAGVGAAVLLVAALAAGSGDVEAGAMAVLVTLPLAWVGFLVVGWRAA